MKIILTTDKNAKVEMYIKEEMDKIMEVIKNGIEYMDPIELTSREFYENISDILSLGKSIDFPDESIRNYVNDYVGDLIVEFGKTSYEDVDNEYNRLSNVSKSYISMILISAKELLIKIKAIYNE